MIRGLEVLSSAYGCGIHAAEQMSLETGRPANGTEHEPAKAGGEQQAEAETACRRDDGEDDRDYGERKAAKNQGDQLAVVALGYKNREP